MDTIQKNPVIAVVILIVVLLCCCLVVGGGAVAMLAMADSEISSAFEQIQEGVSGTPAPVNPVGGRVLFSDDFSVPSDNWYVEESEEVVSRYAPGGFSIKVLKTDFMAWQSPEPSFSDVRIEVQTQKLAGPDDNEFGVFCRYQDNENFYLFSISSDGYYGIGKYVNDEFIPLGNEFLEFSETIQTGNSSLNTIVAECKGDQLSLSVNGELLMQVTDDSFTHGLVSLYVSTYDDPGAEILFSNLVVREP